MFQKMLQGGSDGGGLVIPSEFTYFSSSTSSVQNLTVGKTYFVVYIRVGNFDTGTPSSGEVLLSKTITYDSNFKVDVWAGIVKATEKTITFQGSNNIGFAVQLD